MSGLKIRWVIVLGVLSMLGIISVQMYWVFQAYSQRQKQFDQSISIALLNVAEQMAESNGHSLPYEKPVIQYSSNYYIVNINDIIDANLLEQLLKKEFNYRGIELDFEYAIYDCASDAMVYGDYVKMGGGEAEPSASEELAKWDDYIYYFGIHFPKKNDYLINRLKPWLVSSLASFIVVILFAYSLFVIFRQKRLSEVQKDFINNMTHEFKTPITTIGIATDVLSEKGIEKQSDRLRNYVGIIKSENTRLHNQVLNVLQMARADKGQLNLNVEQLNLHEQLRKVCQHFNLTQPNLKLHLDLEAENRLIKADKLHLNNVLNNLMDNAIKYTKGSPEIWISTRNRNGHVYLKIQDNGIGIPEAYQKRVFEKFFRVPTGNVHDVKGFGLGLNYVANIAKAHKWDLKLKSKELEGTSIEIGFKNG